MITVCIYKGKYGRIRGFRTSGHADYADQGSDIVCSAVSILEFTCVNSIDILTRDGNSMEVDMIDDEGVFEVRLPEDMSHDTEVLMSSLLIGIKSLTQQYDEYIQLIYEEV